MRFPKTVSRTVGLRRTPRFSESEGGGLSHYQSLVVSRSQARRQLFTLIARESGWDVIDVSDADDADVRAESYAIQIVLVDLEPAHTPEDFRRLCERLTVGRSPILLVVYGRGGRREEHWARAMGAWIYLSGLEGICQLESLFSTALGVAQRVLQRQVV